MGVKLYLAAKNLVAKLNSQPDELLRPCPFKSPPQMNAANLKCNGFETILSNSSPSRLLGEHLCGFDRG
jgi:hypothetical protein